MKAGCFTLNNVNSETMHVFIEDRPNIPSPKRRVSFLAPLSFEGELVYDDDGYEPTEFELKCFYDGSHHGDNFDELSNARNKIFNFFNQGKGDWLSFIPYFDEGHEYHIIALDIVYENKYYYDGCISFTVKVKCQPYKYLTSNRVLSVTNGQTLTNPTFYTAKPTVFFSGVKGDIDITFGTTRIGLRSLNNETVYIDSQTYSTFTKSGNTIRNLNDRTIGKEFFELQPGNNAANRLTITTPPNNTAFTRPISINPNWRVLV